MSSQGPVLCVPPLTFPGHVQSRSSSVCTATHFPGSCPVKVQFCVYRHSLSRVMSSQGPVLCVPPLTSPGHVQSRSSSVCTATHFPGSCPGKVQFCVYRHSLPRVMSRQGPVLCVPPLTSPGHVQSRSSSVCTATHFPGSCPGKVQFCVYRHSLSRVMSTLIH